MMFRLILALSALALCKPALADAPSPAQIIAAEKSVADIACSTQSLQPWRLLVTDAKFIARGDAQQRVHLYRSAADAEAGINQETAYLIEGDYVEAPAADNDDWAILYANVLAAQSGLAPDLLAAVHAAQRAGQIPDPEEAGIAVCIAYHLNGAHPFIGWVKPSNLGALPGLHSSMKASDQAAFAALPPAHWPVHTGGDGQSAEAFSFSFYHDAAKLNATAANAPPFSYQILVDDRQRWANEDDPATDNCSFSIYLLNNVIVVPEIYNDCWGNHGQEDPAGVYAVK